MDDKYRGEQLVYGDFLKLRTLKIHGEIEQVGILSKNLNYIDRCLFMGFVSYILSKKGYFDVTLYDDSRYWYNPHKLLYEYGENGVYTTDFDEDAWVSNVSKGLTQWTEELAHRQEGLEHNTAAVDMLEHMYWWSHIYKHRESEEKLRVIFLPILAWKWIFYRDPEEIAELEETHKQPKPWVNIPFFPDCPNLVIIKPSVYKKAKQDSPEKLQMLRETLPKLEENVSLVSVDELVAKFIPEPEKKQIVVQNWEAIRERVLEALLKDYPMMVLALENDRLAQAEELLKQSRRRLEDGDLDHAVLDAARACEALLNVLYHKNRGKSEPLQFGELLGFLKADIETDLGPEVYSDLEYIRRCRNPDVHIPQRVVFLEKNMVLQVVVRSELFHEVLSDMLLKSL
jgi:hypothetical protein